MRIPSGDLAPARRHRRRYGRRRSPLPILLAVLLVLAAAAGTYLLRREDGKAAAVVLPTPCVTATPTPAPRRAPATAKARLPAPGQVVLRLLNGTGRNGLARTIGDELARRGFQVGITGNAARPLAGPSTISYGPAGRPAALLVSAHVLGSAVVPVPAAARGSVEVVLGSTFTRLRTAPEAAAYARVLASTGGPVPASAGPRAAASPACR